MGQAVPSQSNNQLCEGQDVAQSPNLAPTSDSQFT
ncbi:MAG: hypothetical protein XXXJIFNMEKO3_00165 [Candidatus Erwinia impunctatus]|nr:hypothetical protein XXXJIFNMEKO_00165 [Culicoides impunctatus]